MMIGFFTADLLERCFRTFIQAALASFTLAITGTVDFGSKEVWKVIGLSAIAAGISAVTSLLSKNIGMDKNSGSAL